ncbi:Glycoside hydrolase, family 28 [Corchorus olitorius]|uniref:Polygalacturonase n=1 Tax=Corchorus olitorius TaxID=93759 RepID=A0A1R3JCU1_9ROSI|nr:Glycoside hydrolase, family 28 [Corchorus olitorius]
MAWQLGFARVIFFGIFLLVSLSNAQNEKTLDVRNYGAKGDGRTDNTKAFLRAWSDACNLKGTSRVYIPRGVFMLGSVEFVGPCKGPIVFLMTGIIRAPAGPSLNTQQWITFRYVNKLIVKGGGTLDGQGASAWPYNTCSKNNNCPTLPISMGFAFVTNARIKQIKSINSKNGHLTFFACKNVNVTNVELIAPADSPNTDGIKIGSSTDFRISRSRISTGDDCVAILSGSKNIDISYVYCGPGHGISVGSLGGSPGDDNVSGLVVKHCTFSGTDNGVRIKTWESPYKSIASNFTFEDIVMDKVRNPIIVDQTYCPHPPCNQQTSSHVQIRDVTYRNIRGTSSSEIAVSMDCSKSVPCKNIVMSDINLSHLGQGPLKSSCSYVDGRFYGRNNPPPCF